jgi:hypothetical protein
MKNEIKSESAPETMGGHTPGTWSVTHQTETDNSWDVVSQTGHCVIATCGCCADEHSRVAANAQLIASAPALLAERDRLRAALKLCARELKGMHSYYHPTCPGGCPFDEAHSAALAALEAAKPQPKLKTAAALRAMDFQGGDK